MELGYLLSVFWFAFISWTYGYSVLWITKATLQKNPIIRFIETFAIGFATFSFIAIIFDILHIPLLLPIYIVLGAVVTIIAIALELNGMRSAKTTASSWELRETICVVIVILAAVGVFFLLHNGSNAYPYLEDDDPWSHVQSVSYVGRMNTYDVPVPPDYSGPTYAFYLEPYPPNYDVIMGLEWQQNHDATWTLKFFNALICALAIVFTFLLAKDYLGSSEKGAFAAVILAALPSFMSHFIWSQTLALAIFPVALYAFLRSLKDASWRIPAIIVIASMMVSQPIVSVVFGIVIIIAVVLIFIQESLQSKSQTKTQSTDHSTNHSTNKTSKTVNVSKTEKKNEKKSSFLQKLKIKITNTYTTTITAIIVAGSGLLLSMLYWVYQFIKRGMVGILTQHGNVASKDVSGWVTDYALQKYTLMDTIFAPHSSRIDQATGFGFVFSILLIISIIVLLVLWRRTFSLSKGWLHLHILLWSAFLLYIVFAPSFGLPSFGSSRFWAYLAIPLVLLITEGTFIIVSSITKQELVHAAIIIILAGLVVLTSLPAKIDVQTAQWPPGVHWQNPMLEIPGYMETQQILPRNTRIFAFCGGDLHPMGFNFQSDPWDPEIIAMRKNLVNASGDEIVAFLKNKNFEYVTLTVSCVKDLGENATNDLANKISATGRFIPVINRQDRPGFILAKVQ